MEQDVPELRERGILSATFNVVPFIASAGMLKEPGENEDRSPILP